MQQPRRFSDLVHTFSLIGIISIMCQGCEDRKGEVPSTFQTLREYRYQEYASEQDCRAHHSNPYYACSQRISFDQAARTEAILAESDIVFGGQYSITNNTIEATFNQQRGTYLINFEIVSDSAIRRMDNNTLWARSK